MAPVNKTSLQKFSELDGLRGIAVLMVMAFHIFNRAPGYLIDNQTFIITLNKIAQIGWAGVDIFFVLSGFLITSILLNTKNTPHYFKNFYARRILRISPLYFLVIGAILIFLPFITPHANVHGGQASWPYFLFSLQNWLVIHALKLGVYPTPANPLWSLAIEEQFYLIWPMLVFFISRRKLVFLTIAILVGSLIFRLLFVQLAGMSRDTAPFLYFSSITRLDGFAVGALLAIAYQSEHWKRIFARYSWLLLIVVLPVIAAIMIYSRNTNPLQIDYYLNTWGYSLIALAAGAILVILTTGSSETIPRRFFRNDALSFFGKYSYAMYLLHFPIMLMVLNMDFARHRGEQSWFIFVFLTFGLTILGSLLTWNLLEKPMLKLKKYFEYETVDIQAQNPETK